MKQAISIFCLILIQIVLVSCTQHQAKYNLDLHQTKGETGWDLLSDVKNSCYGCSIEKTGWGYNRLIIQSVDSTCNSYNRAKYRIPVFAGSKLELSAYLETQGVYDGEASLFISIDGENDVFEGYADMKQKGVKGTTGRKRYSIVINYDYIRAKKIEVGIDLSGGGKVIVDHIVVQVDGHDINTLEEIEQPKKNKDTSFSATSGISTIELNEEKIKELKDLGEIWGYLKYYHPLVATGAYNWDAQLFRFLPNLLKTASKEEADNAMETWITKLDSNYAYSNNFAFSTSSLMLVQPIDLADLIPNELPKTLINKLQTIYNNYNSEIAMGQYYVKMDSKYDVPIFINENKYSNTTYPDAGIRLLCLYRYWAYIKYFYPYKHLIKNWDGTLSEFIPKFIQAKNSGEYYLCALELIGRIQDSHAGIWFSPVLDSVRGEYTLPVACKMIENKLVVKRYYDGKEQKDLQIGDIILKINNVPIDTLIKRYLKYTPGSNYQAQLRDMTYPPLSFLTKTNNQIVDLEIEDSKGKIKHLSRVPTLNMKQLSIKDTVEPFKILPGNIGYIYCWKLTEQDINTIKNTFKNTKNIIFDLRLGNRVNMSPFADWLKNYSSAFCKFEKSTLDRPGAMVAGVTNFCGKDSVIGYKGKVIILVGSNTQSSGECTSMALRTIPNSMIIGSQTAGADGVITGITLPGCINTNMTGSGIYYPDGTQTQRIGIKIDKIVTPTIKGIREGRDEVLDEAIKIINAK